MQELATNAGKPSLKKGFWIIAAFTTKQEAGSLRKPTQFIQRQNVSGANFDEVACQVAALHGLSN